MAKPYDPLKMIPSASAVRTRLVAAEEEVRKLKILLALAESLEDKSQNDKPGK